MGKVLSADQSHNSELSTTVCCVLWLMAQHPSLMSFQSTVPGGANKEHCMVVALSRSKCAQKKGLERTIYLLILGMAGARGPTEAEACQKTSEIPNTNKISNTTQHNNNKRRTNEAPRFFLSFGAWLSETPRNIEDWAPMPQHTFTKHTHTFCQNRQDCCRSVWTTTTPQC